MTCNVFRVGRIWHYRFQIGKVRVQKTTHERNRDLAEAVAKRIYADAIIRENGGQVIPTLSALIAEWVMVRAPTASASHRRNIDTFSRQHLYDLGDLPVSALSTLHIELARNEHLKTRAPASANHWLRNMKLIVNWAVNRDIIPKLPWQVKMLPVQKRPRVTLPIDTAKRWLDAIDAATTRNTVGTAVRLMFGLGLRESEAASARWEWIDVQRGTYTPGITKGKEAEPVSMPHWLIAHLAPIQQCVGLIAPRRNGTQHTPGYARRAMESANMTCDLQGITPHRLRGTFATLLAEHGVPIQEIQRVMRHKSPLTTMAYLERSRHSTARAQNDIGERIGFGRRENAAPAPADPP